jgi:large subunit ribosomal protein L18
MNHQKAKLKAQLRRRRHVRGSITGTPERPRLTVFRSSKHIYAQLIDDLAGRTLAAASSQSKEVREAVKYGGNVKAAEAVGKQLAKVARERGITLAAFDRGHYRFHGRIKALAVAANAAGLLCTQPKPGKKVKEPPAKAAPAPAKAAKEGKEGKGKEKKAKPQ